MTTCWHCDGTRRCSCIACDSGDCSVCVWNSLSDSQKRAELDRLAPKGTPAKKKVKRSAHAPAVKLTSEERARRRQEYEEDQARWQLYWQHVSTIPAEDLEAWVAVPLPPPRGGVVEAQTERAVDREAPPEFRAAMFLRWSKALKEQEEEIQALGTTIARRLSLERLKILVEENKPKDENAKD
jgi:hypothetical protein